MTNIRVPGEHPDFELKTQKQSDRRNEVTDCERCRKMTTHDVLNGEMDYDTYRCTICGYITYRQ